MTVAALFVDPRGPYPKLLGPGNFWDAARDARTYAGPHPVVAHPPCQRWVNMAAVNWKRYGRELPAWYPGGSDSGCFAAALHAVLKYGGVLEHPAGSHAWRAHELTRPEYEGWPSWRGWRCHESTTDTLTGQHSETWTCEVWQSAYGHRARKRTWLLYCGQRQPFELRWDRHPGTHQVGWFDRAKPTLSKREASATPVAFAEELIRLAQHSRAT